MCVCVCVCAWVGVRGCVCLCLCGCVGVGVGVLTSATENFYASSYLYFSHRNPPNQFHICTVGVAQPIGKQ